MQQLHRGTLSCNSLVSKKKNILENVDQNLNNLTLEKRNVTNILDEGSCIFDGSKHNIRSTEM